MSCESGCFEIEVSGCDDVELPIQLAAMATYKIRLQRPGKRVIYERDITANSTGHPILSGYPAGLFNRGEIFRATIHNEAGETIQFLVESQTYSCVQITFTEKK